MSERFTYDGLQWDDEENDTFMEVDIEGIRCKFIIPRAVMTKIFYPMPEDITTDQNSNAQIKRAIHRKILGGCLQEPIITMENSDFVGLFGIQ